MSLKAYQTPQHCTMSYETIRQDLLRQYFSLHLKDFAGHVWFSTCYVQYVYLIGTRNMLIVDYVLCCSSRARFKWYNHKSAAKRTEKDYLADSSTQAEECEIKTKRVKGHKVQEVLIVAINVSHICEMYCNFWFLVAMVTEALGVEETKGTWEQSVFS